MVLLKDWPYLIVSVCRAVGNDYLFNLFAFLLDLIKIGQST